jgi:hypothetical protein
MVNDSGSIRKHQVGFSGHEQSQTTTRYAYLAADPAIEVADKIYERLASSLNPIEPRERNLKVVLDKLLTSYRVQNVCSNAWWIKVTRRLHNRNATYLKQIYRLKFELAGILLSFHLKPPVPSKHPNSASVKPATVQFH